MVLRCGISPQHPSKQAPSLEITLTSADVRALVEVVDYYQRSMGFMRHVIRATTRSATRQRLRYIADESKYLGQFIRSEQAAGADESVDRRISFTPPAAVAFWGRLLSCLNTPRSRRKLSAEKVTERESASAKVEAAVVTYAGHRRQVIAAEIQTRRLKEQAWMLERLGWAPPASLPDPARQL